MMFRPRCQRRTASGRDEERLGRGGSSLGYLAFAKERPAAFMDAAVAIIMTILVLELERPEQLTWTALWDMRMSFVAYAVSFFRLAVMWTTWHRGRHLLGAVSTQAALAAILVLFAMSLVPYTTRLVVPDFSNGVAQTLYALVAGLPAASCMQGWQRWRRTFLPSPILSSHARLLAANAGITSPACCQAWSSGRLLSLPASWSRLSSMSCQPARVPLLQKKGRTADEALYPGQGISPRMLAAFGIRAEEALRRSGVPEDTLAREAPTMTAGGCFAFMEAAGELAPEKDAAVKMASTEGIEQFSPPIFASCCAADGRACIGCLGRYKSLIGPMEFIVAEGGGVLSVEMTCGDADLSMPAFLVEIEFAFLLNLIRTAARLHIVPVSASMQEVPENAAFAEFLSVPSRLRPETS